MLVVDDLDSFAEKYTRYIGAPPTRNGTTVRFSFALGSRLTLVHWRDARSLLPGTLFPPIPGIAAVAFQGASREAMRDRLEENGFSFAETPRGLIVPAEQCSGLTVIFEAPADD